MLYSSMSCYVICCTLSQLSSKSRKIDSLESSVAELQQEYKMLQSASHTTCSTKLPSIAPPPGSHGEHAEDHDSLESGSMRMAETAEISTQTTETAFMLCTQCSSMQSALVNSASLVSGLCKAHSLRSRFGIYDWKALVNSGGIEISKWYHSLQVDVAALEENAGILTDKMERLTAERDKLGKQVTFLKDKNHSLDIHLKALKVSNNYCMLLSY